MSKFEEKEAWFSENSKSNFWKFSAASASEFYRDLFPVGSFEERVGRKDCYEKTEKGNGFIVYTVGEAEKERKHTRIVFDDLAELYELLDNPCAFMSPISYFGRNRTAKNARYLYALAFDLDEVGREQIENFFGFYVYQKRIPRPTYVVNSGGGVHLYYVFEKPIPMTPRNQKALKILKYELTPKIWNEDTSGLEERQYQGLNQGFRLVGSKTKHGETVTCWKTGGRVTVQQLTEFIPKESKDDVGILYRMFNTTIPLEEAREKYPEWYQQRIVMGRKKMSWNCNRKLYEWWKRRANEASLHHRYWYVFALTVYGAKCGVPKDEIEEFALSLIEPFNALAPNDPFTEEDVYSALNAYDEEHKSFTRDEISRVTAIEIKANKRRKISLSRADNLQIARMTQAMLNKVNGTSWRNEDGRPPLKKTVWKYLSEHPDAKKCEVIRETGLSRPTVYKYYDECRAMVMHYEDASKHYALTHLFDNAVKDKETGEPIDIMNLLFGLTKEDEAPKPKPEDFYKE